MAGWYGPCERIGLRTRHPHGLALRKARFSQWRNEIVTSQEKQPKSRNYTDRFERYAEARRRNRKKACREAGSELRETVAELRRQIEDRSEELRQSA